MCLLWKGGYVDRIRQVADEPKPNTALHRIHYNKVGDGHEQNHNRRSQGAARWLWRVAGKYRGCVAGLMLMEAALGPAGWPMPCCFGR